MSVCLLLKPQPLNKTYKDKGCRIGVVRILIQDLPGNRYYICVNKDANASFNWVNEEMSAVENERK
jgi:hypothetical protein